MGGGRGGLPDTKRGGGQSTSGPIYEKWGGGAIRFRSDIRKVGRGAIRFRSITKSGGGWGGGGVGSNSRQVQKLRKPGPAPHKRTLTLLGGEGSFEPPEPPLATGLSIVYSCTYFHLVFFFYFKVQHRPQVYLHL